MNAAQLLEAGIRPITLATDLLKPGGYLRLAEMAGRLEPLLEKGAGAAAVDAEKLERLTRDADANAVYRKAWRGEDRVRVAEKLPLLDCYVAPCRRACPIHQDVPEYIRLTEAGRFDQALEVIYRTNPLPNITGHICDHPCMRSCTRMDYEGPVGIREVKRIAAAHGKRAYRALAGKTAGGTGGPAVRAAVIGAGPAGLAAAYFLAKSGLGVTVFEKSRSAGGVVAHVLPRFRIPAAAVRRDIRTIASLGVDFRFGAAESFLIPDLKSQGFKYIFLAIGAEVSRKLELAGDNPNVLDALQFLRSLRARKPRFRLGSRVAVVGGGNTAMDGARAALRQKGVREVTVIYRRTEKEMPADREELENAARDGVKFEYLLSPESFDEAGVLRCRVMRLGSPDASGRRRPEPTGEFRELSFDAVIGAIGEQADLRALQIAGLEMQDGAAPRVNGETLETSIENVYLGGDAFRGPATVVQSIADARRAAAAMLQMEKLPLEDAEADRYAQDKGRFAEIYAKKGKLRAAAPSRDDRKTARNEYLRCLECDSVCSKCVDVCPNRANLSIPVEQKAGLRNPWQILHLDALCNECGNCATFCPYEGRPYKDKLTLFASQEDFEHSANDGFCISRTSERRTVNLRLHGVVSAPRLEQPSPEAAGSAEMGQVLAIIRAVLEDHGYLLEAVCSF
jgi:putative selenate reductase